MIVLKFGGTSVGSVKNIETVRKVIASHSDNSSLIVVFSAFGGVTNKLERAINLAKQGNKLFIDILNEVEKIHLSFQQELTENPILEEELGKMHEELSDLLTGVFLLREVTSKSNDLILSYGERISSKILFEHFRSLLNDVQYLNSIELLICDESFGNGVLDLERSQKLVKEALKSGGKIHLAPGFIGSTVNGDIITFGRGGSDYTASLYASFSDADELEIWSDVDGLMTADPRWVSSAHVINHLSYEEALELSHFGAKVIYPPSIQPALEKNIPIRIKNTFKPEMEGTLITRSWEDTETIRGISSISDITLLNLTGSGMVGIPSFSSRLFQALSEKKVNVILITQASSEHTITVGISTAVKDKAVKAINQAFENEIRLHRVNPVEVEDELAIVALVGSNMRNQVGVAGQMFSTLGRNGVSIKTIAQGSSERNISLVIDQQDLKKAVNSLHESFFANEIKKINLFMVGVGNVGTEFLDQVKKQQKYLREDSHLEIRVVGIANSRKMHFDPKGIPLDQWTSLLFQGEKYSIDAFLNRIEEFNLRNSIFVDVTASSDVAEVYSEVLKRSISVVTPNKIAATSPFQHYSTLKHLAKRYKTQFLFETNVCAGLPVISTLGDLIKSGDRIHKIEGVFSGTLNFIFNTYDGKTYFSDVIRMAQDAGFTEPDPRLDLSGEDVMRKILILVRESGYVMDAEDITVKAFVPEECMNAEDIPAFYKKISEHEAYFKKLYDEAATEGKKLRYVASFTEGKASTGLRKISEEHPFFQLEGKDNIVLFYTDRYKEQPLVIKGAGAGAAVTASGIFADIMKVANANA